MKSKYDAYYRSLVKRWNGGTTQPHAKGWSGTRGPLDFPWERIPPHHVPMLRRALKRKGLLDKYYPLAAVNR